MLLKEPETFGEGDTALKDCHWFDVSAVHLTSTTCGCSTGEILTVLCFDMDIEKR